MFTIAITRNKDMVAVDNDIEMTHCTALPAEICRFADQVCSAARMGLGINGS